MISNDVLEWALESTQNEIDSCTKHKKPVPDELITRKTQIEAKLQVLIIKIQNGQLSEEQYIQSVNDKITEEKALAKKYLTQKNNLGAKYALMRAKIMAKELEGEEE